jgi:hypothetical protein
LTGSAASIAASFGVTAGLGYLIGGWTLAVVLPAALVILMGIGIAVGLKRRRTPRIE